MTALVSPIHVEALGLANLRFFAPPSGGREFPWLAIDDLHACLTLPRNLRREFKSRLKSSEWKKDARTLATVDGTVDVVPHYMAQGLIDAMRDVGQIQPDFYMHYAKAGARAFGKLTNDLSPAELMTYIGDAYQASGGAPRG